MLESEVIARVARVVQNDVGYSSRLDPNRPRSASPSQWSKFDQNNWHGYWCARGIASAFIRAVGVPATLAAIGRQPGMTAGWAATWLWRDWFKQTQDYPGLANGRLGDVLMVKFPSPSGGRASNPTNHVDFIVNGHGSRFDVIGYNTLGPSGSANPGEGGTVSRHVRYSSSGMLVGAYRPDYGAAAKVLGAGPVEITFRPARPVEEVQAIVGVKVDGSYGPTTRAAVKAYQSELNSLGYTAGTPDGLWGKTTDQAQEEYMSEVQELITQVKALRTEVDHVRKEVIRTPGRIADTQVTFLEGTSLHEVFGASFRFGALVALSARDAVRDAPAARKASLQALAAVADSASPDAVKQAAFEGVKDAIEDIDTNITVNVKERKAL